MGAKARRRTTTPTTLDVPVSKGRVVRLTVRDGLLILRSGEVRPGRAGPPALGPGTALITPAAAAPALAQALRRLVGRRQP